MFSVYALYTLYQWRLKGDELPGKSDLNTVAPKKKSLFYIIKVLKKCRPFIMIRNTVRSYKYIHRIEKQPENFETLT